MAHKFDHPGHKADGARSYNNNPKPPTPVQYRGKANLRRGAKRAVNRA